MIQMQEGGMNSGQVEFDVSEGILLELSCRETQAASRVGIHLSKCDGGISQLRLYCLTGAGKERNSKKYQR